MEKNQHNRKAGNEQEADHLFAQGQPGQQLPSNAVEHKDRQANRQEKEERHSESSLPQNDNETLGTP